MSVAFYSEDSDPIHRKIPASDLHVTEEFTDIDDYYEISRCVEWINRNNYFKIALQFPDNLLKDSDYIALKLWKYTKKKIFVNGDTTYGSCCVDEIAPEHVEADAIIHFGHACLSSNKRLPVLYIFGKSVIDVYDAEYQFKRLFADVSSLVIVVYEVVYFHAIKQITKNLKEYENLVVSELEIPCNMPMVCEENLNNNHMKITKCRRLFLIPKSKKLDDYCVFYIGSRDATLANVMLSFNYCKIFSYNPLKKIAQHETLDVNRYLRKRYFYIEKTKDAKKIGILVGTLEVSNYRAIIDHLIELIKGAGKKSYTIEVGKLNVAKLANFPEIEIFVNVACMESTIVDSHDFYQSFITPFELEVALNQAREWTGDYVTDFSELLPGAVKHVPVTQIKNECDVSLITGKMRCFELKNSTEENLSESSALTKRDDMSVSTIHSQAAGEYLSERSWKGLEQCLGETPVADIQQGQKGIACAYEDEGNK